MATRLVRRVGCFSLSHQVIKSFPIPKINGNYLIFMFLHILFRARCVKECELETSIVLEYRHANYINELELMNIPKLIVGILKTLAIE